MFLSSCFHTPRNHLVFFFFFNDTATTEIYTLSLHDALPICRPVSPSTPLWPCPCAEKPCTDTRSEEHTSELQSPCNLVCRLLLEKKKNKSRLKVVYIHDKDAKKPNVFAHCRNQNAMID